MAPLAGSSIDPWARRCPRDVTIQDAGGNTVTSATNTVTLAIGTNPGSSGLTVNLVSDTPTVASVTSIPQGANVPSANPQITGVSIRRRQHHRNCD